MEKNKFYTQYNRPTTLNSETGSEYDKTYTITVDDNGHKKLEKSGLTNRYKKVQAHAEECKIENILATATIDPKALNQRQGQYFDATEMPKTMAEAQTKIIKLKNEFLTLPLEVREKFNHSAEQFIAAYGTEDWGKKIGLIKEVTTDVRQNSELSGPAADKKEQE